MNITREQLMQAYGSAPRTVREYLVGAEFVELMQDLGKRYGLHVDVVGKLSMATSYLLLGLTSPSEFVSDLTEAGLFSDAATKITSEVNEKIFKPLREKLRGEPTGESATGKMDAPPRVGSVPQPAPSATVYEAPRARAGMPPANLPGAAAQTPRRPVEDATPPATVPALAGAQAKTPITAALLRNAQSAEAAEMKTKAPPRAQTAGMPSPPAPHINSVPPIKEYGTDPYREPVE